MRVLQMYSKLAQIHEGITTVFLFFHSIDHDKERDCVVCVSNRIWTQL